MSDEKVVISVDYMRSVLHERYGFRSTVKPRRSRKETIRGTIMAPPQAHRECDICGKMAVCAASRPATGEFCARELGGCGQRYEEMTIGRLKVELLAALGQQQAQREAQADQSQGLWWGRTDVDNRLVMAICALPDLRPIRVLAHPTTEFVLAQVAKCIDYVNEEE